MLYITMIVKTVKEKRGLGLCDKVPVKRKTAGILTSEVWGILPEGTFEM